MKGAFDRRRAAATWPVQPSDPSEKFENPAGEKMLSAHGLCRPMQAMSSAKDQQGQTRLVLSATASEGEEQSIESDPID